MPKNYLISIGGTGSRCLESLIYLSAAGLFQTPMQVLMVDPDQNNGNGVRTKKILPLYHALFRYEQPKGVKQRAFTSKANVMAEPVFFQAAINAVDHEPNSQFPFFWQDPNKNDRRFRDAIDFTGLNIQFQKFVQLFYEEEDLEMKMGKGYRGRPNIGAVTLTADLQRTIKTRGNALYELVESIRQDLRSNSVRVFVMGSVFGGTGAAGLPVVPELLRNAFEETGLNTKLQLGCAMMTPYFTFEKSSGPSSEGPVPDSDEHQVATQAALLHYSSVPPGYQHAYVIGSPDPLNSKVGHQPGGERQENDCHYAELVAALSARDFFTLEQFGVEDQFLHYTDSTEVTWNSLPVSTSPPENRRNLKLKMLAFTTFAYFYHKVLHNDLKNSAWRLQQAWYKDNFVKQSIGLENAGQDLDKLNDFTAGYIRWLSMIGQSVESDESLFKWGALSLEGYAAIREIGKLSTQESENSPRYVKNSYGKIMEKVNRSVPIYGNTVHPVGLLIYLFSEACSAFCQENYYLVQK